ncbi:hypothetical protein [Rhodococcus koreensis]
MSPADRGSGPGFDRYLEVGAGASPARRRGTRLDRRHQARQAYAFVPHGARRPGVTAGPPFLRPGCAARTIPSRCAHRTASRPPPAHRTPRAGTLAWEASYHRRVGIESLFADLKRNRLGVHRGYFRGFGLRRYNLLAGFTLAALNILNLHDWATRREVLDSWGRFLGEPESERRPRRRRRSTHSATRRASSLAATGPGR